tara:strand:+ start:1040 stop:2302 length:1263 start_codon:yes stop_codon:yes gene_type:complete
MATHDYVIDNSTGANVRADINLVLQAILTNNSSSSAPSTTAAYMWWADTTNGVLKIRNSANNDWVELLQLDGTLTLEDGSNSAPALAFRDDLDTGIYSSAANTFNIATGGVERMELGTITVFNEDGADVDFRIKGDTDVNLFYLDAGNNRIGIGTSSPSHKLHVVSSGTDTAFFKGRIITFDGAAASDSPRLNLSLDGTDKAQILLNRTNSSLAIDTLTSAPITFDTNSSEAMRIENGGFRFGNTTNITGEKFTVQGTGNLMAVYKSDNVDNIGMYLRHAYAASGQNGKMISFRRNDGTEVGSITIGNGSVTYNTSSDYRLKENEVAISDGITRLKTLKPYKFNFKDDPNYKYDGFFAHEVSTAVPEAVYGEKDAIEEDGSIKSQSLDHSKLIPLLTAALQESVAKIEVLETKVAALEAA